MKGRELMRPVYELNSNHELYSPWYMNLQKTQGTDKCKYLASCPCLKAFPGFWVGFHMYICHVFLQSPIRAGTFSCNAVLLDQFLTKAVIAPAWGG